MENEETPENVLPDPTADLHWAAYRGAVHDIFAGNAARFPDRLCVLETKSRTTPQREFTYKQIHEASNIVAHHFLQCGIERGEVIMIYAYRGVDLVISILAVLKAGATFSVVDPAYDSLHFGEKRSVTPSLNHPDHFTDILRIDRLYTWTSQGLRVSLSSRRLLEKRVDSQIQYENGSRKVSSCGLKFLVWSYLTMAASKEDHSAEMTEMCYKNNSR